VASKPDLKHGVVKMWICWGELLLFVWGISRVVTKPCEGLVGEGGGYRGS